MVLLIVTFFFLVICNTRSFFGVCWKSLAHDLATVLCKAMGRREPPFLREGGKMLGKIPDPDSVQAFL